MVVAQLVIMMVVEASLAVVPAKAMLGNTTIIREAIRVGEATTMVAAVAVATTTTTPAVAAGSDI
jgi:hypothetical protein